LLLGKGGYMKNPDCHDQTMALLQDAVLEFDSNLVRDTALLALTRGVDSLDAIVNGLGAGMGRAGELYARGEYFLPELTMCADTFYAGLDILRPHIQREAGGSKGTVVIGTVEGDRHDIGKNVVKLLLEASGFAVCDLGVDVCPEQFVQESIRADADLVCVSVTLTTGLSTLPRIVDMLRTRNPKVRILVGGSAILPQQALRWGVDGYARDAWGIWDTVTRLTGLPAVRAKLAPVG
jgi:methylmalonyl-CoA mutase cobalamin-binding domain/chain